MLVTGVLIFNSLYLQASMVKLRNEARANSPTMVNTFHYYNEPSKERGEVTVKVLRRGDDSHD